MHLMQIDLSEDIQILCIARDNIEKIVFAQVCTGGPIVCAHARARLCARPSARAKLLLCVPAFAHARVFVCLCRWFDITRVLTGGCEQAHRLSAKIATMDEVVLDSGADAAKQV